MRILGIDPGTATTGWGVVQTKKDSLALIHFDCIKTVPEMEMPRRLLLLSRELSRIIKTYKPDVMVVEQLFFNSNAKTAMTVGQARGVVMMTGARHKVKMFEYTALTAKMEIFGYGRASKKEMQQSVKEILGLQEAPKSDDAADAIAMALCHVKKHFNGKDKYIRVNHRTNHTPPVKKKRTKQAKKRV